MDWDWYKKNADWIIIKETKKRWLWPNCYWIYKPHSNVHQGLRYTYKGAVRLLRRERYGSGPADERVVYREPG